jgi:hypothetical protein
VGGQINVCACGQHITVRHSLCTVPPCVALLQLAVPLHVKDGHCNSDTLSAVSSLSTVTYRDLPSPLIC